MLLVRGCQSTSADLVSILSAMGDKGKVAVAENLWFLLVGSVLLVTAWIFVLGPGDNVSVWEMVGTTLMSLAFVVITVVALRGLWWAFGGDPLQRSLQALRESAQIVNDSHETGVVRVLSQSQTFGNQAEWIDLLKAARRSGKVDLMGFTLNAWLVDEFDSTIMNLVRDGVQVRAVLTGPNAWHLTQIKHQYREPETVKAEIAATMRRLRAIQSELSEDSRKMFAVRTCDDVPIASHMVRVDDQLVYVPYLWCATGPSCPLLRISRVGGGQLFELMVSEFESYWAAGAEIPEG